jgi:hypothetical protein
VARRGIGRQAVDGGGERLRVGRRDEPALDAVEHDLGNGRGARGHDRQALGQGLDHDVRQPVAVAVGRDLGGEDEEVARAIVSAHRRLIEGPPPT